MCAHPAPQDPALANESWDRFLPQFKKANNQRPKRKTKESDKKPYNPFPPAPTPRKVDLQLESGEYFLSQEQKQARRTAERDAKQAEASAKSAEQRERRHIAPDESGPGGGAGESGGSSGGGGSGRGASGRKGGAAAGERSVTELAGALKAKGRASGGSGGAAAAQQPDTAAATAATEARAAERKRLLPESKKKPKKGRTH